MSHRQRLRLQRILQLGDAEETVGQQTITRGGRLKVWLRRIPTTQLSATVLPRSGDAAART
jgi:hypothetical protein